METDTIAAISTALGEGGIAVIRVSGEEVFSIVDQIYQGKRPLLEAASHTVQYGHVIQPQTKEVIDEVLVTVMRAPRTFTREDTIEISCHGGLIPVQKVLESLLLSGARLAEPGEFTKRAFLNGRIDLSQAEAVIDLIRSKTDQAAKIAMQQADGKLSHQIRHLRHEILESLAHLAVNVDYPEYDAETMTKGLLAERCTTIKLTIERLLQMARQGKIMREGLSTAIVGRPNVGKSSLLNTFIQENKAIVTEIPGTTRDILEEYVNVRGIPLRLLDTAGIRETDDIVEKIGVQRSQEVLQAADLLLIVLNYAEPLQEEDQKLLALSQEITSIVIVNKTDLPQKCDLDAVKQQIKDTPMVTTSLKQDQGIEQLEEAVAKHFFAGQIASADATYVSNARHIQLLEQAKSHVQEVLIGIESGLPLDLVEIDLKNAWQVLGEVIGEAVAEDLLDQIFSQFCLGK